MNVCTLLQSSMKQPTLYRNALWETLRTLTSQQAASYLETCYKVIYILFLCARYWTTLLSFYDPPKLHLVWFSFYKRCGSDILQQRSSKSTRQLSPMYINLQMNVLYVSIFFTDIGVFSCWLWHSNLKKNLRKVTFFDFVWCIKQIFSRRE